MRRVFFARLAKLFQLKTGFDRLLVFRRVVIEFFTLRALELDECLLGHRFFGGAASRVRTADLLFTKQLLYR